MDQRLLCGPGAGHYTRHTMNRVKCANDATPHLDFGHLAKMAMGSGRVATETSAAIGGSPPGIAEASGTAGATLDSVHFQFQTAQLLSECQGNLALIAAWAQRNPSAQIEVQGYLDQREALNKYSWDASGYIARSDALSDLRAYLVRDALISAGVGSD
jgi:outer membrane protein OmpA-like peptidoglycan-associated protein